MNASRRNYLILVLLALVTFIVLGWLMWPHHGGSNLRAHYTKYEYRIPMRDGVRLYTAVYVPMDNSHPYPFLIMRTPFGAAPYGGDNFPSRLGPSEAFDRAGYIFVVQDVRGRYQSEGRFVDVRPHIDNPSMGQTDESTDMHDTVEWLLKNVRPNNGNVGIWGMSYPGFYVSASIIDSHPAIKAASPEAPVTDLYRGDDAYHNGAFMLAAQFLLYSSFFRDRRDGPEFPPNDVNLFDYDGANDAYKFFLQHGPDLKDIAATIHNPLFDTNIAHNTYDDYWKSRDVSQHLHNIHCAVLNVGGWFDAEDLAGPLRTYRAIEEHNPGIENVLVVGPWEHGAWVRSNSDSPEHLEFDAAQYYREHIAFPFFEHYLKGGADPKLPEATVFETGTNAWRQYDSWPPKNVQAKMLYFHANGKLSFNPPAANEAGYDVYVSDPGNPVPYIPYPTTELVEKYIFGDQYFASERKDVLTYVSDPLPDDITIVGSISPRLHISSSGTDSDFDVKLIDVFPGEHSAFANKDEPGTIDIPVPSNKTSGYEQLVRGEPMRAKFRDSFSNPKPLIPNQVTPVAFTMPDINHTFRRGHRIMIQIQSSWFPLTDLNPQTFVNPAEAKPSEFVKATERVYHTPQSPSGIEITVLPSH